MRIAPVRVFQIWVKRLTVARAVLLNKPDGREVVLSTAASLTAIVRRGAMSRASLKGQIWLSKSVSSREL